MGAVRSAFITSRSGHRFPGRDGEHMRLQAFCAFNRLLASVITCFLAPCSFMAPAAWAGPPFISDDPEPVEYHHAELYIASLYSDNKDGKLATLPHFEFNYGALPDMFNYILSSHSAISVRTVDQQHTAWQIQKLGYCIDFSI